MLRMGVVPVYQAFKNRSALAYKGFVLYNSYIFKDSGNLKTIDFNFLIVELNFLKLKWSPIYLTDCSSPVCYIP